MVTLTLGERGALLVTTEQTLPVPALRMEVSSAIGAGDSLLARTVWAMTAMPASTKRSVMELAVASATLLSVGTAL